MHTTITIPRAAVIDDLGRLTHYTSAKATADDTADDPAAAWQRVALQRADDTLLATWFRQAAAQASTALRHLLAADACTTDDYRATLILSDAFDPAQVTALRTSLHTYFVQALAASWFALTAPDRAAQATADATAALDDALRKCFHKQRPRRPHR